LFKVIAMPERDIESLVRALQPYNDIDARLDAAIAWAASSSGIPWTC